jgi:hypothetical protein
MLKVVKYQVDSHLRRLLGAELIIVLGAPDDQQYLELAEALSRQDASAVTLLTKHQRLVQRRKSTKRFNPLLRCHLVCGNIQIIRDAYVSADGPSVYALGIGYGQLAVDQLRIVTAEPSVRSGRIDGVAALLADCESRAEVLADCLFGDRAPDWKLFLPIAGAHNSMRPCAYLVNHGHGPEKFRGENGQKIGFPHSTNLRSPSAAPAHNILLRYKAAALRIPV